MHNSILHCQATAVPPPTINRKQVTEYGRHSRLTIRKSLFIIGQLPFLSQPKVANAWLDSARHVGLSRATFANRFRELVGTTPMQYLTSWRMQKARELLRDSRLPLFAIANRVGYASESAFSRAFKREFQQNPGAMRKLLTSISTSIIL